jgi:hypothetical protein
MIPSHGTVDVTIGEKKNGAIVRVPTSKLQHLLIIGMDQTRITAWLNGCIKDLTKRYSPHSLKMAIIDTRQEIFGSLADNRFLYAPVAADKKAAMWLTNKLRARIKKCWKDYAKCKEIPPTLNEYLSPHYRDENYYRKYSPENRYPALFIITNNAQDLLTDYKKGFHKDLTMLYGFGAAFHIVTITGINISEMQDLCFAASVCSQATSCLSFRMPSQVIGERIFGAQFMTGVEKLPKDGTMMFGMSRARDQIRLRSPFKSQK